MVGFFRGLHKKILNIDLLPMLMIDDEFSLVEKEVLYFDKLHGGGSVLVKPLW